MSKYQKGDKVWIEGEVVNTFTNHNGLHVVVDVSNYQYSSHFRPYDHIYQAVFESEIKKHLPVPKPIEVGCRVKYLTEPSYFVDYVGKVIAINGDRAWVYWDLNREYSGGNTVAYLHDLKRID